MNGHHNEQFWIDFIEKSPVVRECIRSRQMRSAFDMIEALLVAHGYDFAFELTEEESSAVLVLSPEGDTDQARRIDELIALCPQVSGWKFYGRRQRKAFKDAVAFVRHIYSRDVGDAVFQVGKTGRGQDVTVITRAMEGLSADEVDGLAATLLDHALGEDVIMSRVSAIRGALPLQQYDSPVLSLLQLDALLRAT
jgi:hypothetical protein